MQAVCRSEEFKASSLVNLFLTLPTVTEWEKAVKVEEKKKPSDLQNLLTADGSANVSKQEASADFCAKMPAFIEDYQKMHSEVIACSKDIKLKSNDLAKTLQSLTKAFTAFSELQSAIKEPEYASIFN